MSCYVGAVFVDQMPKETCKRAPCTSARSNASSQDIAAMRGPTRRTESDTVSALSIVTVRTLCSAIATVGLSGRRRRRTQLGGRSRQRKQRRLRACLYGRIWSWDQCHLPQKNLLLIPPFQRVRPTARDLQVLVRLYRGIHQAVNPRQALATIVLRWHLPK
ncbi:hypothetical protein F443_04686 [Phytophthora nicotianae P1569]|uniref:Uncharacterized protein n=2 Tax=Phytophthora nicotianae P1569 TaxID=1317065 RepID=V9FM07_PHYNI|nr:hypothetical protein F443_04686 [Phytophthora nicotianae P1569]